MECQMIMKTRDEEHASGVTKRNQYYCPGCHRMVQVIFQESKETND